MVTFVRATFTLLIALIASLFAVENMHEVPVGIFPVASTVSLPVYLIVLGPLAVGLIVGWALARISGGRARSRRRRRDAARTVRGPDRNKTPGRDNKATLPAAP